MRLRIEKAVYGGAGLAHAPEDSTTGSLAGKTVFVPMTLPGELVEARITEDRGSFANAEVESIVEASPERTVPGCPYYGICGGCHYQHASYSQQLEMKAAILRETLERGRALGGNAPAMATLAAAPWGYRNRIRLHVMPRSGDSPPRLGYRERGAHTTLPVEQCPIAAPVLVRALQAVQRLSGQLAELGDEIEFFTNSAEESVLLSISTSNSGPGKQVELAAFCSALKIELRELKGAAVFFVCDALAAINRGGPNKTGLAAWGEQHLTYGAAGFDYRVSLGSFFQVNRLLVDKLVDLVTRGYSGKLAWDLYAGAGLFSRALTSSFRLVRAVESSPSSCADLRVNLAGARHKVVESSTVEFLRLHQTVRSRAKPDLVVVDPPRAGLGGEVATLLAQVAPRDIVYVSCDPATLARDLRALVQSGYRIESITLVDLFPQTFHLESVSRLSLR